MGNMPKKTKFYSRFLLLRIYPDSPVHMSASTKHILTGAVLRDASCCACTLEFFLIWGFSALVPVPWWASTSCSFIHRPVMSFLTKPRTRRVTGSTVFHFIIQVVSDLLFSLESGLRPLRMSIIQHCYFRRLWQFPMIFLLLLKMIHWKQLQFRIW